MDDITDLEVARTRQDIRDILQREQGRDGFFRDLDDTHSVSLIARGTTLLVTFEHMDETLAHGPNGLPLGLDFVEDKNWSLLHFATTVEDWFRSGTVFECLDDMVDDAFFENFDQVMFYGAGMSGYAAAAFSVVAPGARVLVIRPQATLDVTRTEWDDRYPSARRLVFHDRYGFAPQMLEGAEHAVVLYDPFEHLDCVHASLFQGDNVDRVKVPHLQDLIETSLREMDLLHRVIEMVASGQFTRAEFGKLMRVRRSHPRYLRNLLTHLDGTDNPGRIALFCAHVLSRMKGPAFRRRLNHAREELEERGELPDWLRDFS